MEIQLPEDYVRLMNDLAKYEPDVDMPLDAGIRRYVLCLRSGGVETFESCQGGEGHPFTEPTIRFYGDVGAGFKAFGIAMDYGLPVFKLARSYRVNDGFLTGPSWEMVFSEMDRYLLDQRPALFSRSQCSHMRLPPVPDAQ